MILERGEEKARVSERRQLAVDKLHCGAAVSVSFGFCGKSTSLNRGYKAGTG